MSEHQLVIRQCWVFAPKLITTAASVCLPGVFSSNEAVERILQSQYHAVSWTNPESQVTPVVNSNNCGVVFIHHDALGHEPTRVALHLLFLILTALVVSIKICSGQHNADECYEKVVCMRVISSQMSTSPQPAPIPPQNAFHGHNNAASMCHAQCRGIVLLNSVYG